MKALIVAAIAAVGLGGCIAVPGPYAGDPYYYYPAPAVGVVGVYSSGGYSHRHHRDHQRPHRRW